MSEMGNNLKETSLAEMERILADQKKAYLDEGIVSTETRHDRIERAINILMKHDKIFADAMSEDFGHRSQQGDLRRQGSTKRVVAQAPAIAHMVGRATKG